MNSENERAAPGIVFKNYFGRRIRQDAAIPKIFAIDTDGWKGRGQRSRRHDVFGRDVGHAAVEIMHHASADIGSANGQSRRSFVDNREVNQLTERLAQCCGQVKSRAIYPERDMRAPECWPIGLEESGDTADECRPARPRVGDGGPSGNDWRADATLHSVPELVEFGEAILRLIARNDAGVDGADRCADDPIRFNPRLVQRLIDTNLIGT